MSESKEQKVQEEVVLLKKKSAEANGAPTAPRIDPEKPLPVFLRKTPMTYSIINAHQKTDPNTNLVMNYQGIVARFTNDHPGQVCKWEPEKMLDEWVRKEVIAGHIGPDEEDSKRQWLKTVIIQFIERNVDFKLQTVYLAPTKDEVKAGLEKQKEELEARIKELEDVEVTDTMVDKVVDEVTKEISPTVKSMTKGGGLSKGGSTTVNKR